MVVFKLLLLNHVERFSEDQLRKQNKAMEVTWKRPKYFYFVDTPGMHHQVESLKFI